MKQQRYLSIVFDTFIKPYEISALRGANSDATVQKDKEGRPFIPGKTLKGLLREAAEILQELGHSEINETFITDVFGRKNLDDKESKEDNRIEREAKSFFGNATLSAALLKGIDKKIAKHLYQQVASTAIEANGQAKNYSLRSVEVTVPLVLYASVNSFDKKHKDAMKACFSWIKRMGLNRNRGLGRCQFTIHSIED